MIITWPVFTQYEPHEGSSTASAMAPKTALSSMSKYAGDTLPRVEKRMVFAPANALPGSPKPWVAVPGGEVSAALATAERISEMTESGNML